MAGWASIESLINEEKKQAIEEGSEPEAVAASTAEAHRRLQAGAPEKEIWAPFCDLPRRADFGFVEPSDLVSIRADRPGNAPSLSFAPSDDVLFDKMYGAWLGRCVGCALGKPVEGYMGRKADAGEPVLESWERQKVYLTSLSEIEWPIRDYFPKHAPGEARAGFVGCHDSTRDQIAFMETDDDIRYTVLGQIILKKAGRDFTSTHVVRTWLDLLGYQHVCTAETQAYRNIVIGENSFREWRAEKAGAETDARTDWAWITHHLNPYREWIGAQIRIDSYGYGAAGNAELAADFAWRDARISHTKNGIYGAMFCAAMIAAAFATDDVNEIIRAGLAQIPQRSRLYAEMLQTIDICRKHDNRFENFEAVIKDIYALLGHYHPVHTNNNAAICVAALLLSNGDFHQGITFAVMGGWDTDCNGATVGSIVGAICGAKKAPTHWIARLNDTLNSYVVGYHPIAISECAKRATEIWKRINA